MSINDPIETLKLSHEDVTLDYTHVIQENFYEQQFMTHLDISLVLTLSTRLPPRTNGLVTHFL